MNRLLLVVLSCTALLSLAQEKPQFGPEQRGLQLGLTITPEADGSQSISIKIKNNRANAIKIHATNNRRAERTLGEILRPKLEFDTSPKVGTSQPQTFQSIVVTKMMLRNGETGVIGGLKEEGEPYPVLSEDIEPQRSFTFTWKTTDSAPLDVGQSACMQTFHPFPPGNYSIRARLRIETSEGPVSLWSNEASLVAGKSEAAPKPPIAIVQSVDLASNHARLKIGRANGAEVGDRYFVSYMGGHSCILSITELKDDESRVTWPKDSHSQPVPSQEVYWMPPEK
jgi:hypothetical protein